MPKCDCPSAGVPTFDCVRCGARGTASPRPSGETPAPPAQVTPEAKSQSAAVTRESAASGSTLSPAPPVPVGSLDGPRVKTLLDREYEKTLDIINRQRERITELEAALRSPSPEPPTPDVREALRGGWAGRGGARMKETRAERLLRRKAEHVRMVADTYRRSDQRAAGMRDDDAEACDCGREALALLRGWGAIDDADYTNVGFAQYHRDMNQWERKVRALLTRAGAPSQEDR
jgi:hypothetical protein